MYGPNLTPEVQTGLAWFFLLCALLNLGAAAHWTFWSRGQKLVKFEQTLLIAFIAGYSLLTVAVWPFHLPVIAVYWIGAISNAIALFLLLPASIYQKVTAGIAWCCCAIAFQLLGLLYAHGAGVAMPTAFKN